VETTLKSRSKPLSEMLPIDGRGDQVVQAYCVKCKTKREMKNPKKVKMKNGKPATKGECPKCGTTLYRIGG
jgi:hypothetical protein